MSVQAEFIGGTFSWKRTSIAQMGERGIGLGKSKIRAGESKGNPKSPRSSVLRTSDLCLLCSVFLVVSQQHLSKIGSFPPLNLSTAS